MVCKRRVLLLILVPFFAALAGLFLGPVASQAAPSAQGRIDAILQKGDARMNATLGKEVKARREALDKEYLKKLEVEKKAVHESGDLEGIAAYAMESARVRAMQGVPSVEEESQAKNPPPPALSALRRDYRAKNEELIAFKNKGRRAAAEEVVAELEVLEKELASEGDAAGVALARKARADLLARVSQPDTPPRNEGQKHSESAEESRSRKILSNGLGMRFLPLPGSRESRVFVSIWETRVQDFSRFAESTNREWKPPSENKLAAAGNVSWNAAQAFCSWLTENERASGRIGPKDRYRLPTDHEWSLIAGIGGRERPEATPKEKDNQIPNFYSWGREWPPPAGSGNFFGEENEVKDGSREKPLKEYRDPFPAHRRSRRVRRSRAGISLRARAFQTGVRFRLLGEKFERVG
ncbi:MAG: SUMF1/EgtB/PvdO family nonheme iron enzyme [Verrucomicrobiales bacterium]|nr:SUMF1/EgtB/PvdO family nonheme iron enzyme [Verrucomicrobiales bacterium]